MTVGAGESRSHRGERRDGIHIGDGRPLIGIGQQIIITARIPTIPVVPITAALTMVVRRRMTLQKIRKAFQFRKV